MFLGKSMSNDVLRRAKDNKLNLIILPYVIAFHAFNADFEHKVEKVR